jgi:hypothetical protein
MIGVFIDGVRIGSIIHFPKLAKPCWVAYAMNTKRQSFKLKREAVSWLETEALAVNSQDQT